VVRLSLAAFYAGPERPSPGRPSTPPATAIRSAGPVALRDFYDVLEPVDLIVIGRLATLLLSLAAVALLGRMAARFAGEPAAGSRRSPRRSPALVIRGGIVTVDVYALLAVLGALELADRARLFRGRPPVGSRPPGGRL